MKIVRCVILVAVCVFVGRGALAQAPAKPAAAAAPAEGASGALTMLPEEVDLAVVVERGSEIRASKWGDAIGRIVGDAGTIGEMNKAWDSLATQLGWSRNEAFDRLLGGRVTLASKAMGNGGERRWVLLSDVSPETEQRLKERLLAAPRAIVEGHQILTLENGEYELATHHWPNPARGKKGPADRVTLVLCAMGKSELFDQVLARMNAGAGAVGGMAPLDVVAQAKAAEGLAGKEAPTVLFVASLADGNVAGRAPWSDFVMLAGQPIECDAGGAGGAAKVGPTWRTRVVVRQAARHEELLAIEPTSDAPFRALSSGALVAAVQTAPLPEVIGNWARFTTLGSLLPLPDEAKKAMTPHQAVSCRTVEPEGRVSCTFAMRAADTGAMARTLDGPIAAWIARVEKQLGAECPPMRDFAGVAPNAVRVAPFAEGKESAAGMISSKPLAVSWVFPSRPIGTPSAVGGAGVQEPGWWVVNVSQMGVGKSPGPTAGEIIRGDADALVAGNAGGAGGEIARWVWLASARPGAIEKLLPTSIPDLNGFRAAMKRLERLDMQLKITDVGDIQGDLDVRLADSDALPSAGAGPVSAAPPNGK